ncbi:hypothetical protein J1N35_037608 [Gossypium stocksii]|uniref:Uncharacterized protein n=1 Tax=Gossypium stocksii TaxID=47602 RepID=A0A9D3UL38_9ROSI|nr:hypothetical protein J1N35_037608 [Gossypium stocksii]
MTIDVGKIIFWEMRICAARHFGPAYFPFTITILCLKAKILANIKKTSYSPGTITNWDLYRIVGDFVLQQRVEDSEDPEEGKENLIEIKPIQSAEIPGKAEPMEPITELASQLQCSGLNYLTQIFEISYQNIRLDTIQNILQK